MYARNHFTFSALILIALWLPQAFAVAPDALRDGNYAYQADDATLAKVLQDFANNYGLTLSLAKKLNKVRTQGRIQGANAVEFLDRLAAQYKLQWFIYGGRLYVSPPDDFVSSKIEVGAEAASTLKQALAGVGLLEPKFGWGELPGVGVVMVSGPHEYIRLIRSMIPSNAKSSGQENVQVFRLRYALVEDRVIQYRDRQIVAPGVANLLRTIIGERPETNNDLLPVAQPLVNTVNASNLNPLSPPQSLITTLRSADAGVGKTSRIAADVRTNAIVIKDTPERYAFFRQLIDELDVPQQLIAIEAMIVDINRDKLADIGVEFSAANRDKLGESRDNGKADAPSHSLFLLNDFDRFYNRLRALEKSGEASIVATPTLMTLDNMSAVLDLSKSTYLPLMGERSVDVKEVTAGTLLRVTPHKFDVDQQAQLQLIIDIEDGNFIPGQSGNPTVQRSLISTQAIVTEGQSLVIGGYDVQHFEQAQRLFIITPHVILK
jgi:type III secretion protein C